MKDWQQFLQDTASFMTQRSPWHNSGSTITNTTQRVRSWNKQSGPSSTNYPTGNDIGFLRCLPTPTLGKADSRRQGNCFSVRSRFKQKKKKPASTRLLLMNSYHLWNAPTTSQKA